MQHSAAGRSKTPYPLHIGRYPRGTPPGRNSALAPLGLSAAHRHHDTARRGNLDGSRRFPTRTPLAAGPSKPRALDRMPSGSARERGQTPPPGQFKSEGTPRRRDRSIKRVQMRGQARPPCRPHALANVRRKLDALSGAVTVILQPSGFLRKLPCATAATLPLPD